MKIFVWCLCVQHVVVQGVGNFMGDIMETVFELLTNYGQLHNSQNLDYWLTPLNQIVQKPRKNVYAEPILKIV